ncbi:hypothetical protein E2C01_001140 [Portunus trituberculatus]|uniref:Uncharacterized protein n=1 Tax=Portunus trituberculatus TaxID=210409 RepID=A0A5B7CIH9_PORTR|nr:hypothetical protein [Portunus trituberculatus]
MEDATSLFTETDPILERSIKFKSGIEELLLPYKETLRQMKASASQRPITSYFMLSLTSK